MNAETIRGLALLSVGAKDVDDLKRKMLDAITPAVAIQTIATFEVAAQLAELNNNLRHISGPKFSGDRGGYILTKVVSS